MFLTSRMNFTIIGHDLEVLWKKTFVSFFDHFWGCLPFDPKIFAKKCPFELKYRLLTYFCMGNPKKMVSGRSVDPPRFQRRRFLLKSTLNIENLKKKPISSGLVVYHGTKSPKNSRKIFKKKIFPGIYPDTKSPF
jgi:hypothetical protein